MHVATLQRLVWSCHEAQRPGHRSRYATHPSISALPLSSRQSALRRRSSFVSGRESVGNPLSLAGSWTYKVYTNNQLCFAPPRTVDLDRAPRPGVRRARRQWSLIPGIISAASLRGISRRPSLWWRLSVDALGRVMAVCASIDGRRRHWTVCAVLTVWGTSNAAAWWCVGI